MLSKLLSPETDGNPWAAQDRIEQRKILATALIFAAAVLGGLGWLAYALFSA